MRGRCRLIDRAQEALKAQKAAVAQERLSGRLPECPWVFPTLAGKYLDPDYVTDTFERIAKRAGTEKPLHAMRHATASILLGAGVPPAVAAKIMGHASLAVFYRTYADLLESAAQDAARQVERFLAAAAGGRAPEGEAQKPERHTPGRRR